MLSVKKIYFSNDQKKSTKYLLGYNILWDVIKVQWLMFWSIKPKNVTVLYMWKVNIFSPRRMHGTAPPPCQILTPDSPYFIFCCLLRLNFFGKVSQILTSTIHFILSACQKMMSWAHPKCRYVSQWRVPAHASIYDELGWEHVGKVY